MSYQLFLIKLKTLLMRINLFINYLKTTIMKNLKYIFVLAFFASFFISCTPESLSSSNDTVQTGGDDHIINNTERDGN